MPRQVLIAFNISLNLNSANNSKEACFCVVLKARWYLLGVNFSPFNNFASASIYFLTIVIYWGKAVGSVGRVGKLLSLAATSSLDPDNSCGISSLVIVYSASMILVVSVIDQLC